MKFFLLLIVTSSATLAASATDWVKVFSNSFDYFKPSDTPRFVEIGDDLKAIYSRQPFNEATDTLQLGSVSFEEATKKLEDKLNANPSDNPLILDGFKYKTSTDWVVGTAKGKDDRGFLVALHLREIYHRKLFVKQLLKEEDHVFLGEATQHVLDAFFTAEAQPDFFILTLLANWGRLDFLKLVDRAIAEGRDSLVDALIWDTRTRGEIKLIWENIKPGTKFPDLVGPHLYEYAMKEIGTPADDKANRMLIKELGRSEPDLLRFMALLDKTDPVTHENALSYAMSLKTLRSLKGDVRRSVVAALLAYEKWENFALQILEEPDTEDDQRLKALWENDKRIRRLLAEMHKALAEKHKALAKQYEGNNDEPKDHQRDEVYEQFKLWNIYN